MPDSFWNIFMKSQLLMFQGKDTALSLSSEAELIRQSVQVNRNLRVFILIAINCNSIYSNHSGEVRSCNGSDHHCISYYGIGRDSSHLEDHGVVECWIRHFTNECYARKPVSMLDCQPHSARSVTRSFCIRKTVSLWFCHDICYREVEPFAGANNRHGRQTLVPAPTYAMRSTESLAQNRLGCRRNGRSDKSTHQRVLNCIGLF